MDVQRIYAALEDRFGAEIVVRCFGKHITKAHARRLKQYEIYSTEEYVLLAVLLGMEPSTFFSGETISLVLREKMSELEHQGQTYTKARAAQMLGIREDQLLPYAKRFHIQPFWTQSGKLCTSENRQTYPVTIHLSQQEREALDTYMAAHNMDAYTHALRYFMKQMIDNKEVQTTNEVSEL